MGRRRKYFSDEERANARSSYAKKFYWNNKDKLDELAKELYRKKKLNRVSGSIGDEEISLTESDIQEIDGKQ